MVGFRCLNRGNKLVHLRGVCARALTYNNICNTIVIYVNPEQIKIELSVMHLTWEQGKVFTVCSACVCV